MTQRRWLCGHCEREWVFAYNWSSGDSCPACGSVAVKECMYVPKFPGADIPRGGEVSVPPEETLEPAKRSHIDNPPIALVADVIS